MVDSKTLSEGQLKEKVFELEPIVTDLQNRMKEIEKELKPLLNEYNQLQLLLKWINEPVCNKNYYAIRGGGCKHGDVYHGNVHCNNPYCDA
jgi:hypothetical protein